MFSEGFTYFEPSAPPPRWAVAASLAIISALTAFQFFSEPSQSSDTTSPLLAIQSNL